MSKKREYPLELFDLIDLDNGSQLGIVSKGHHDIHKFIAAITEYSNDEIIVEPCDITHEWVRLGFYDGEQQCFYDAKPGSRGAFPLTRVSIWRIFDEPEKRDYS